jgi:DNA (cytosine-5)-methyltransferase 1
VNEPTHLDLFSGIGGFALAAKWAGFRTVAFCEIDKYCQKILAKNFGVVPDTEHDGSRREKTDATEQGGNRAQDGILERSDAPRLSSNIFDFDGTKYRGCDLLTGGFPCQPFSFAGKRRGAADDRALWSEMFRVIKEARPTFCLAENVPGIIPMELDNVLSDLEGIGYACRSFVIPACAVDARHRRDRLWIVGRNISDSNRQRLEGRHGTGVRECAREWITGPGDSLPDADQGGFARWSEQDGRGSESGRTERCCRWQPEPAILRVAHGIPNRVDRLKGLGNAIVPQVAYEILREIRNLIT